MSRDTQFMNYAMLVHNEILAIENEGLKNNWNNIDIYRRQQEIMARRAYDLVLHAVENVDMVDLARLFRQEIAERIPDMTELPKDQEQKYMYFIDNGDCHGSQALEGLEPLPKEKE